MSQATGKVTVVYYWSTLTSQTGTDFAVLKKLNDDYAKDLAVVAVNLDDDATVAAPFAAKNAAFATHLHQPGGMNGPLATQYGIFGLPQVFLVDATGKVVSNKIQVNMLDDEIAKLVKKSRPSGKPARVRRAAPGRPSQVRISDPARAPLFVGWVS
jgi:hypothetical protein